MSGHIRYVHLAGRNVKFIRLTGRDIRYIHLSGRNIKYVRINQGSRGLQGKSGASAAIDVSYDGTGAGTDKTNVQDALDELYLNGPPGGGTDDHGQLLGLLDDDHPQYLTEIRANALYAPLLHNHDAGYF